MSKEKLRYFIEGKEISEDEFRVWEDEMKRESEVEHAAWVAKERTTIVFSIDKFRDEWRRYMEATAGYDDYYRADLLATIYLSDCPFNDEQIMARWDRGDCADEADLVRRVFVDLVNDD